MADEIWTRRDNESPVAHEAFKAYIHMGDARSVRAVADALSKSETLMKRWSSEHDWPARSVAYDRYVLAANTDGMAEATAEALIVTRDKNLALMDKLRGLLDSRLDQFIERKEDPTIRWTQACVAMTKIEANALIMGKEKEATGKLDSVMAMVEKLDDLVNRVPEQA